MGFKERAMLMDKETIKRAIQRIAHEIVEKNKGAENVVLIGIQNRGVYLARRLAESINSIEKVKSPVGALDISFYRDDIATRMQPKVFKTEIDFDVSEKDVVLVDDVLFTGRTIRAAMGAIIDFGRPATIQVAVLVDRGHRELPIRADYVGKNIPTAGREEVKVMLDEEDGKDTVLVGEPIIEKKEE